MFSARFHIWDGAICIARKMYVVLHTRVVRRVNDVNSALKNAYTYFCAFYFYDFYDISFLNKISFLLCKIILIPLKFCQNTK